jgi:hypothetical protein
MGSHQRKPPNRDFVLRGGFFMGDDFWAHYQWETFRPA